MGGIKDLCYIQYSTTLATYGVCFYDTVVVLVGNELENIHCTCVCIARSGILTDRQDPEPNNLNVF